MSSIARKMLERHGWKEGMGLGKDAQGVSTYVKVVRRDPRTATGLGHAADATQAPQASTFSVELDAVYATMTKAGRKSPKGDDAVAEAKVARRVTREKRGRQEGARASSSSRGSSEDASSDGGSSSSDEDEEDRNVDITRLTDDELLRRCGGVRLGRAGRHRFFDGKLRRIEKSHRGEARDAL
ncbi:uncharacterized protein Tco025E_03426 [Trypanosoma conorhini]|uniref:G-patch domain-containing protein n=1 Tax=Trypanosoma conorhini TaxID=83891 RepID=A0A422PUD2_9TRYP|nr:uncharacterized protein Tco025E_03426 [Trypanosoma conorhini]RNF21346.1 hypothetical protein Tco025E_03426 [Trypanosoma conorhini]